MGDAYTTTYRTVPFVPGDLYNGDTIAMPPYPVLAGTAKGLLLVLRREWFGPLDHPWTREELAAIAYRVSKATNRTIQQAIDRLIAGGYLVPLEAEEDQ
jgi:hypothetical protein